MQSSESRCFCFRFQLKAGQLQIGAAGGIPTLKFFDDWNASDEVSWTHGKHTLRFGGEYERDRYDWYFKALSIGSETFPDIADFLVGLAGCSTAGCSVANPGNTNGTAFSNLSASGNYQSETPPGGLNHAYRDSYAALFIQDDVKLTRKLTANLGLRWEYLPIMIDAKGFATNINPNYINANPIPGNSVSCPNPSLPAGDACTLGTLAGFVVPSNFPFSQFAAPGVGGVIQSTHKGFQPNNTPLDDFSPRIGLAWSPLDSNRLSVRSGIGIFRDRSGALNYIGGITQAIPYATPLFETTQQSALLSSLQQPYTIPANPWTPRTADFTTGLSSNLTDTLTTPNYNKTPTTYEWNLTVQYQFKPTWTVVRAPADAKQRNALPDAGLGDRQLPGVPVSRGDISLRVLGGAVDGGVDVATSGNHKAVKDGHSRFGLRLVAAGREQNRTAPVVPDGRDVGERQQGTLLRPATPVGVGVVRGDAYSRRHLSPSVIEAHRTAFRPPNGDRGEDYLGTPGAPLARGDDPRNPPEG